MKRCRDDTFVSSSSPTSSSSSSSPTLSSSPQEFHHEFHHLGGNDNEVNECDGVENSMKRVTKKKKMIHKNKNRKNVENTEPLKGWKIVTGHTCLFVPHLLNLIFSYMDIKCITNIILKVCKVWNESAKNELTNLYLLRVKFCANIFRTYSLPPTHLWIEPSVRTNSNQFLTLFATMLKKRKFTKVVDLNVSLHFAIQQHHHQRKSIAHHRKRKSSLGNDEKGIMSTLLAGVDKKKLLQSLNSLSLKSTTYQFNDFIQNVMECFHHENLTKLEIDLITEKDYMYWKSGILNMFPNLRILHIEICNDMHLQCIYKKSQPDSHSFHNNVLEELRLHSRNKDSLPLKKLVGINFVQLHTLSLTNVTPDTIQWIHLHCQNLQKFLILGPVYTKSKERIVDVTDMERLKKLCISEIHRDSFETLRISKLYNLDHLELVSIPCNSLEIQQVSFIPQSPTIRLSFSYIAVIKLIDIKNFSVTAIINSIQSCFLSLTHFILSNVTCHPDRSLSEVKSNSTLDLHKFRSLRYLRIEHCDWIQVIELGILLSLDVLILESCRNLKKTKLFNRELPSKMRLHQLHTSHQLMKDEES